MLRTEWSEGGSGLPSVEEVAFALHDTTCNNQCEPTHMALQFRQADAVLALFEAAVPRIKAEALREAAVASVEHGNCHRPGIVSDAWLRARATAIQALS